MRSCLKHGLILLALGLGFSSLAIAAKIIKPEVCGGDRQGAVISIRNTLNIPVTIAPGTDSKEDFKKLELQLTAGQTINPTYCKSMTGGMSTLEVHTDPSCQFNFSVTDAGELKVAGNGVNCRTQQDNRTLLIGS